MLVIDTQKPAKNFNVSALCFCCSLGITERGTLSERGVHVHQIWAKAYYYSNHLYRSEDNRAWTVQSQWYFSPTQWLLFSFNWNSSTQIPPCSISASKSKALLQRQSSTTHNSAWLSGLKVYCTRHPVIWKVPGIIVSYYSCNSFYQMRFIWLTTYFYTSYYFITQKHSLNH